MSKKKTALIVLVALAIVTGVIFLTIFLTKPPPPTKEQVAAIDDSGVPPSPLQWCLMRQGEPRTPASYKGELPAPYYDTAPDFSPNETPPTPSGTHVPHFSDPDKGTYYSCWSNVPMYSCVLAGSQSFKTKAECKLAGQTRNYCSPPGRRLVTKQGTSPPWASKDPGMSQMEFCNKKTPPKWKQQQAEMGGKAALPAFPK